MNIIIHNTEFLDSPSLLDYLNLISPQVYYQCTQRAKLGCGSLCHVVYHHVGTALLYTNGEPHNHIEYNSILNSNPPPANVAISNLNVQVRTGFITQACVFLLIEHSTVP